MKRILSEKNRENTATVLFVSDTEYVLSSVDRIFSGSGIRFLKAVNARKALDMIARENMAVVVSDNYLPDMKGIDLLSKVRNISPVTMKILITNDADLITAVKAINNGEVSRVIMKPWSGEDLFQNVKEVIIQYHIARLLKKENKETLLSIVRAVELKDLYTLGHCSRVAVYASMLAQSAGVPSEVIKDIRYGSLLHDFGKIHIPEHILNKKGPLSSEEHDVLKKHPGWGANVAKHLKLSPPIINIICHHHERYDGTGYPAGIKGEDIPLEARIVTIADIYDALTSDRQYRRKYSDKHAVNIMKSMNGKILDPELLDVFIHDCLMSGRNQIMHVLDEPFKYSGKLIDSAMDDFTLHA